MDAYDFCLNSSALGLGGTVELIRTMVAHKEHPIPSPTEQDPPSRTENLDFQKRPIGAAFFARGSGNIFDGAGEKFHVEAAVPKVSLTFHFKVV
ncbi:MAG: hypothetical protein V8R27_02735 [Oscillospiraceae bacterium]